MYRKKFITPQRILWAFVISSLLIIMFVVFTVVSRAQTTPAPLSITVTPVIKSSVEPSYPDPVVMLLATPTAKPFVTVAKPLITVEPPIRSTVLPTVTLVPTKIVPTPLPEPTAVPAPAQPDWLTYLNKFRAITGLAPLIETEALSFGAQQHSRYMTYTDRLEHVQHKDVEWYSPEGHEAAKNGNIVGSYSVKASDQWAIDYWISAPFHLIPMIDPELRAVGYGATRHRVGQFQMTAVLNMQKNQSNNPLLSPEDQTDLNRQHDHTTEPASLTNPILFPGRNAETWVIKHSIFEWPNPKTSCPGYPNYPEPIGPPIVVQIGSGNRTPNMTQPTSFSVNGNELDHCVFDETNYTSPNARQQRIGRIILDQRDAIVLLPRHPLEPGKTYTVRMVVNGVEIMWHFTAVNPPA
ncbi:MAG: CAP domain-containing protein [Chloroflexota bacterium]